MFVVKVPFVNGLGKTEGCQSAGNEVLRALNDVHMNEQKKPINTQILDIEEIHVDNSNISLSNELIYKNSLKTFQDFPKSVFIGGDHSISYEIGRAFLKHSKDNKKEPCIIVFDAHVDLMEPMKEPTHEEWLRALIESGFPSKNVLIVGARNIWKDEMTYLREKGISLLEINNIEEDIEEACNTIMEFSSGKDLYLSIDIDVIDPSFAPGTGYPESGGLTSRQFLYLISRINKIKSLKIIDMVEINPKKDLNGQTVRLGAKILSEII